ncbi:MAG: sulfatase [Pseudomonadota bacterium]|nr:sulfatase [Pseudomonadota bacterium]
MNPRPAPPPPLPHPLAYAWYGLAGGLCGGSAVGAIEALAVLSVTRPAEYEALAYAYLLYGVVGAAFGAGVGALLVPVGRLVGVVAARAWCLGFFAVAAGLGTGIARAALPGAATYEGLLGVGFGVGALVGVWLGGHLLTKTPLRVLPRPRGTFALWGGGLVVATMLSLSPAPGAQGTVAPRRPQPGSFAEKPDVLLIVVEGLRADALTLGAAEAPAVPGAGARTPALAAFARDAVVFEQHVAASSWSRAAVASLLASRAPSRHGAAARAGVLRDDVVTLAELLRNAGYATAGLPDTADLAATWGLDQGFDWYPFDPRYPLAASASARMLTLYGAAARLYARVEPTDRARDHYRPAPAQLDRVGEVLDANGSATGGDRTFVFVHLAEPGGPWFPEPADGTAYRRADHPMPPPDGAAALRPRYLTEVERVDGALGRFFADLKARGRYDGLLIVVTGSHGLELGDHGGAWDGASLYDELLHVPLLIKLPGGARAGTRVPWQVRQVDLAPTVADLAGFDADAGWEGTSLFDDAFDDHLALLHPPDAEEWSAEEVAAFTPPTWAEHPGSRDALSELDLDGMSLQSVRSGGRKLVQALRLAPKGRRLPALACYDLLLDPGELRDLTRVDPSCPASLAARLQALAEAPPAEAAPEPDDG